MRDKAGARRFLQRTINMHGVPGTITIDTSGADTATIESLKADAYVDIPMRQSRHLNNIGKQDHRGIKRNT